MEITTLYSLFHKNVYFHAEAVDDVLMFLPSLKAENIFVNIFIAKYCNCSLNRPGPVMKLITVL